MYAIYRGSELSVLEGPCARIRSFAPRVCTEKMLLIVDAGGAWQMNLRNPDGISEAEVLDGEGVRHIDTFKAGSIYLDRREPIFDVHHTSQIEAQRVPWYWRAVEIPIAFFVLFIASPILLLTAYLISRDTRGPALFFQTRIGAGAKPFRFVKFRTLYADARERFPELYAYKYDRKAIEALKFKVPNDPRVTPVGAWLRESTLDEIPNFWCVLTGKMALVGPRPEIPEMLPYYEGEMLRKFEVRPGITGLAQVSGRGRLGFLETVMLDVEYVKSRNLMLDVKIIFLTIRGVFLRDGAF